eukprot:COSAG01_NODE_4079_length_5376_cov_433.496494_7_plen_139_part_00
MAALLVDDCSAWLRRILLLLLRVILRLWRVALLRRDRALLLMRGPPQWNVRALLLLWSVSLPRRSLLRHQRLLHLRLLRHLWWGQAEWLTAATALPARYDCTTQLYERVPRCTVHRGTRTTRTAVRVQPYSYRTAVIM